MSGFIKIYTHLTGDTFFRIFYNIIARGEEDFIVAYSKSEF